LVDLAQALTPLAGGNGSTLVVSKTIPALDDSSRPTEACLRGLRMSGSEKSGHLKASEAARDCLSSGTPSPRPISSPLSAIFPSESPRERPTRDRAVRCLQESGATLQTAAGAQEDRSLGSAAGAGLALVDRALMW
jgi:hypothetical protein